MAYIKMHVLQCFTMICGERQEGLDPLPLGFNPTTHAQIFPPNPRPHFFPFFFGESNISPTTVHVGGIIKILAIVKCLPLLFYTICIHVFFFFFISNTNITKLYAHLNKITQFLFDIFMKDERQLVLARVLRCHR